MSFYLKSLKPNNATKKPAIQQAFLLRFTSESNAGIGQIPQ
jgi:hypothetical protein